MSFRPAAARSALHGDYSKPQTLNGSGPAAAGPEDTATLQQSSRRTPDPVEFGSAVAWRSQMDFSLVRDRKPFGSCGQWCSGFPSAGHFPAWQQEFCAASRRPELQGSKRLWRAGATRRRSEKCKLRVVRVATGLLGRVCASWRAADARVRGSVAARCTDFRRLTTLLPTSPQ